MSGYISPEMKLWALRVFLFLRELTITSWDVGTSIASAAYTALQPNDYVFYTGYTTPVQVAKYSANGPGTPTPYWYYNPSKRLFFKTSSEGETHSFPFLSLQLTFNQMNLYSLDEFVSQQQYVGEMPPPLVVVGAWSLVSGTMLDRNISLCLNVINENGEEIGYSPWAYDWVTIGISVLQTMPNAFNVNAPSSNTILGSYPIAGLSVSATPEPVSPAPAPAPAPMPVDAEDRQLEFFKHPLLSKPITSPTENTYIAADNYEDNSAAAYPTSYDEAKQVRQRLIYTAEPAQEPSSLAMVDLSGNLMKVD